MIALLLACVAMACRDAISTFETVAKMRDREVLAGVLDAAGDVASIAVTVAGAGPVIQHGITFYSSAVIGAMLLVSFAGTIVWTRLAQRIGSHVPSRLAQIPKLGARVTELERRLNLIRWFGSKAQP